MIEEHGEQLWTQPLLTLAVAAGTYNRRLSQGQHPERRVDGEDRPERVNSQGIGIPEAVERGRMCVCL